MHEKLEQHQHITTFRFHSGLWEGNKIAQRTLSSVFWVSSRVSSSRYFYWT